MKNKVLISVFFISVMLLSVVFFTPAAQLVSQIQIPAFLAGVSSNNAGTDTLRVAIVSQVGVQVYTQATIQGDDVTPDISGAYWLTTSANAGATAITDLDGAVSGQSLCIIGGSATFSSTIADSGNFALSAAWTAGLDDVLCLYVQADNDYIEVSRADN